MIKLVYRTPGTSPAALQLEGRTEMEAPIITLCRYDDASLEEITCRDATEAIRLLDPAKNNWIDVNGSTDVETVRIIGAHFGLSQLIVLDILTSQRPKLEHMDEGIFLITSMAFHDPGNQGVVEIEQLEIQ